MVEGEWYELIYVYYRSLTAASAREYVHVRSDGVLVSVSDMLAPCRQFAFVGAGMQGFWHFRVACARGLFASSKEYVCNCHWLAKSPISASLSRVYLRLIENILTLSHHSGPRDCLANRRRRAQTRPQNLSHMGKILAYITEHNYTA